MPLRHDFFIMQLLHHEINNDKRKFPIVLICSEIRTPENIGMLFRIAEAFGVEKIYFHQDSPDANSKVVKRISRDTVKNVPFEVYQNLLNVIDRYKKLDYLILGLEITKTSEPIQKLELTRDSKVAILIGSERNGLDDLILSKCNKISHIPIYGENSSINVVNSTSIALYEISNKLLSCNR
ncbi:MAG: TrmH family RNA methyltransferase [Bacteroidia bacterium]